MKSIVILISGRGSNMQALLQAHLPCRVVAVISSRADATGLKIAQQQGISTTIVSYRDHADRNFFEAALTAAIDHHQPDLIVLAGLGLLSGYSLFGIYFGVTVAGVLRSVALWVLAWRAGIRPVWPFDWGLAKQVLMNSSPLALSAFIALAYQQVDQKRPYISYQYTGGGMQTRRFQKIVQR